MCRHVTDPIKEVRKRTRQLVKLLWAVADPKRCDSDSDPTFRNFSTRIKSLPSFDGKFQFIPEFFHFKISFLESRLPAFLCRLQ